MNYVISAAGITACIACFTESFTSLLEKETTEQGLRRLGRILEAYQEAVVRRGEAEIRELQGGVGVSLFDKLAGKRQDAIKFGRQG